MQSTRVRGERTSLLNCHLACTWLVEQWEKNKHASVHACSISCGISLVPLLENPFCRCIWYSVAEAVMATKCSICDGSRTGFSSGSRRREGQQLLISRCGMLMETTIDSALARQRCQWGLHVCASGVLLQGRTHDWRYPGCHTALHCIQHWLHGVVNLALCKAKPTWSDKTQTWWSMKRGPNLSLHASCAHVRGPVVVSARALAVPLAKN